MGERGCHQADQGGGRLINARWLARLALHSDIEILPDTSGNIGEAGNILLGSFKHLNDRRRGVGIHAQHLGRDGYLRAARLGAHHCCSEGTRVHDSCLVNEQ